MIANLNKAVFAKLINGSLVQVQLGEPKTLKYQRFFFFSDNYYQVKNNGAIMYTTGKVGKYLLTDDM